jgi:hypothetical protein
MGDAFAGESGVAARALPPQSKMRWLQAGVVQIRGHRRGGCATKCPLRGQTTSQRDIIHLPQAQWTVSRWVQSLREIYFLENDTILSQAISSNLWT